MHSHRRVRPRGRAPFDRATRLLRRYRRDGIASSGSACRRAWRTLLTHVMRDPWIGAMLRGDFAAAWSISDRVLRERIALGEPCDHWPRHEQYVWRGGSLRDLRVLVRCYHGLGDTIQFVRLLAPLRAETRRTILWAQPALCE